jgi:hypothetical protein
MRNSPGDAIASAALSAAKQMEPYDRTPKYGQFAVGDWLNQAAKQRAESGYDTGDWAGRFASGGAAWDTYASKVKETQPDYQCSPPEGAFSWPAKNEYPGSVADNTPQSRVIQPTATRYPTSVQ